MVTNSSGVKLPRIPVNGLRVLWLAVRQMSTRGTHAGGGIRRSQTLLHGAA
ncbi:MAG: hypothetical protein M3430_03895 [Acidobacteriota bacterium]|nr:hypothetical protein [Acidobacteriota bacterium]